MAPHPWGNSTLYVGLGQILIGGGLVAPKIAPVGRAWAGSFNFTADGPDPEFDGALAIPKANTT